MGLRGGWRRTYIGCSSTSATKYLKIVADRLSSCSGCDSHHALHTRLTKFKIRIYALEYTVVCTTCYEMRIVTVGYTDCLLDDGPRKAFQKQESNKDTVRGGKAATNRWDVSQEGICAEDGEHRGIRCMLQVRRVCAYCDGGESNDT